MYIQINSKRPFALHIDQMVSSSLRVCLVKSLATQGYWASKTVTE